MIRFRRHTGANVEHFGPMWAIPGWTDYVGGKAFDSVSVGSGSPRESRAAGREGFEIDGGLCGENREPVDRLGGAAGRSCERRRP